MYMYIYIYIIAKFERQIVKHTSIHQDTSLQFLKDSTVDLQSHLFSVDMAMVLNSESSI